MKNLCTLFEGIAIKTILLGSLLLIAGNGLTQENCSNGIDDDGDGLIDCADGDCATDYISCPAFESNNLSCPPSGIYADIIGTTTGFKPDDGTTGPIALNFLAGTETIRIVIQGNYQNFDFVNDPAAGGTGNVDYEHGDDRLIYGIVEVDLASNISSGSVEYLSNMVISSRYAWKDQALGAANTSTYVREGYNTTDLPNFEFVFNNTGAALEVTCLQGDINISYFSTFYGNSASESMTRVDGINPAQYPAYFTAGTTSQVIDLPASGADFITITTLGVNQNRTGNFGALVTSQKEEGNARKEILIDLNTNLSSGIVTVGNGSVDGYCSTYSFDGYDLTSGIDVLSSGAIIVGETSANTTAPDQIGLANPMFQIVGGQLVITRDAAFSNDFNEIYYIKFYKRTGLPWSSGFKEIAKDYISPSEIGYNTSGSVTFTIPDGTRYATVFASGNGLYGGSLDLAPVSLTAGQVGNENQVISYAEIDLLSNTHEGYNVMLATANNQQMYAWTGINVDPAYDFAMFGPTVGQLPSSNDRINFDIYGNTLEVFFTNHTWAMERVVLVTFMGQYPDVLGDTLIQEFPSTANCDSLYFSAVTCNGGSQDLIGMLPYSIYTSDPTVNSTSVLLEVDSVYLNWPIGQCDTISFAVGTNLLPATSGDVYIVFNDDAGYSAGIGNQIGTQLNLADLSNGLSYMAECDEQNNLLSGQYSYIPLPQLDLGNDTSVCGIFSMILNPILDSNYSYIWQDSSSDTLFTANASGSYWVEVTDYRNCTESDTMNITVGQISIDLGIDTNICQGEILQLNATNSGATYLWQDASIQATLDVNASGQYWVEVSQNGCVGIDTIDVLVNPLPIIDLGPDITICQGESTVLDATSAGVNYEWSTGSTAPTITVSIDGSYWIEIEENSCTGSDTIVVSISPLPNIDLGSDVTLCEGELLLLDITSPGASYLWHDGSTNSTFNVSSAGIYSSEITENNCSNSDTIVVVVNPLPIIDLGPDNGFCAGESLVLDATTPGAQYFWQDGSINSTLTATTAGVYSVELTIGGCINSDTAVITTFPLPQFYLGADTIICEYEFTISAPVNYTSYSWQDGSTNSDFLVQQPGNYSVSVTDVNGCEASDIIFVGNGCEPVIWIPNVFTPNNDGSNDEFFAQGTFLEDFHMIIFNRWGEVVKELEELDDTWDGLTQQGMPVNDGTYIWLVNYSFLENGGLEKREITGHVTVLR
ncbi:MAG: gliding motility-associated C-terminal domain-containing protein [Crocinitomicaceae bacterium]|nr:gliding motility-associated C-terminal domain-containing protein [Crocinitomicaceae bacterium]